MRAQAGPVVSVRPGLFLATLMVAALLWPGSAVAQSASAQAENAGFRVTVRDGEVPRAQRVLKVQHQQLVRIEWLADRALVIHLEGYDLSIHADPGKPEVMEFKAFATGRFPVHAHEVDAEGGPARHGHHARPLLRLEVHPK